MAEELQNATQQAENEQVEKIKAAIARVQNKESKFIFIVPEAQNPVASVYEIYFHATVVKQMGHKVVMMVEKGDYVVPAWIEKELTDFEHLPMNDPKLSVSPEDIMVIPEVFTNVMEQTKNLPCMRVGLLQSVDYMMNALIPGSDWSTFGVQDIITTSPSLKEFVETFYGENKFDIRTYKIGIPDYFGKSALPQKPVISVVGRNANDISKFVKLFYSKYPHYSWITFDPMVTRSKPGKPLRRVDYAKRLQENFAAIWIDRIASFGTFPLECMKSGTIPIALRPDIMPEYMVERNEEGEAVQAIEGAGVWTENYYDLVNLTGEVLIRFLDDNINPELYERMDKVVAEYNQQDSQVRLTEIYNELLAKRVALFQSALQTASEPVEEK